MRRLWLRGHFENHCTIGFWFACTFRFRRSTSSGGSSTSWTGQWRIEAHRTRAGVRLRELVRTVLETAVHGPAAGRPWYRARTTHEARYLTVLLNTSCLQHAYTSAKESGRHFDLHPWRKVPIPRYDGTIPLHREIAALCTQAEKDAVRTVAAELEAVPGREQVRLSKAVRNALANDGIDAKMGEYARLLLPDQAE